MGNTCKESKINHYLVKAMGTSKLATQEKLVFAGLFHAFHPLRSLLQIIKFSINYSPIISGV